MPARSVFSPKAFGSRIKELRVAADMSQEDLSEKCGLFRTYVSRIETGNANPTLTMINALAVSLKVPIGDLFIRAKKGSTPRRVSPKPARPSRGRVAP